MILYFLFEVFLLYNIWLSSSQVVTVVKALEDKGAPDLVIERVLCLVFPRVVDLENFGLVMACLSKQARQEVVHRLGILNLWNPETPDTEYELFLNCWDVRLCVYFVLLFLL